MFSKFIIYFVLILFIFILLKKWGSGIQNSEKKNLESKQKFRTKKEVNKDKAKFFHSRLSPQKTILMYMYVYNTAVANYNS